MPPKKTQPNDNNVVLSASQMLEMAAALSLATTSSTSTSPPPTTTPSSPVLSASQLLRMAAASSLTTKNTPTTLPPSFVPSDPYVSQQVRTTFAKLTIRVNSLFAAKGVAAAEAQSLPSNTQTASNTRTGSNDQHRRQQPVSSSGPLPSPRRPRPQDFTAEEIELIQQVLYEDHDDENGILISHKTSTIQLASMQTLRPGFWLNDEPVNYFFQVVLTQRDEQLCVKDRNRKRSHFFNSFFMTGLLKQYDVARWSKNAPLKDIFDLDKVFVPINVSNTHWILGIIDITKKEILILDSSVRMNLILDRYAYALFQYVLDEHQNKKKRPLPKKEEWKIITSSTTATTTITKPTPQQRNGDDCGVFMCYFATCVSTDDSITSFDQGYINENNGRQRIALSILNGTVML